MGAVQSKNGVAVAMKNVIDWAVACLVFAAVGFGVMFGLSQGGLVGGDLFGLNGLTERGNGLGMTFFLFQLAFAGTATTIVSGAMAERTGFVPYLVASVFMAGIIYPVFGHWAWGGLYLSENQPWLAQIGFMDFAGSTVVHSTGAWVGLVGILVVGPRLGRFRRGENSSHRLPSGNLPYAALGMFLLWIGWWGFNGGSVLAFDKRVGAIIVNTNLAGAAGGLAAFVHAHFSRRRETVPAKILGGCLGGLVAITAGCNVVSPASAVAIGLLAGLVHNTFYDLFSEKLKLDDPVGAIAVHGACGVFGTLCVAIFGQQELLAHPRLTQLGVQALGAATCAVWAGGSAFVLFRVLRATIGLRVTHEEERAGLSFDTHLVVEASIGAAMPIPDDDESIDHSSLADLL